MDISYYRDFLAVAKHLNFTMAAEELFESPAVVSKHIISLERYLGVKLFERTKRSVALTKYGALMIERATRIIDEQEGFMKDAAEIGREKEMRIRIITIPVYLHFGVADKLSDFSTRHPQLDLFINETQPQYQMEEFLHGDYDVAVFGFPPDRMLDKLNSEPIAESHIVAVMSSRHPLSCKPVLQLTDLKNEEVLIENEVTGLFHLIQAACKAEGFSPRVAYKAENPETLLRFAVNNMRVALMAKKVAEYYNIPNMKCVEICPSINVNLYLVWFKKMKSKNLSDLLELLLPVNDPK